MSTDETAVRRRADDLHARYRYAFAGKPRITRRLEDLDEIIRAARALHDEATSLVGRDADVVSELGDRVSLYESERERIVEARSQGPAALRATVLGTRAGALFGLYRRHFAGRSRLTRDVALLDDVVDALREIKQELLALSSNDPSSTSADHLGAIERNVELYVAEREAILTAREGASAGERTTVFANVANAQFEAYRIHFAGRSRVSRRVALLDRMIETLEWCGEGMDELAAAGQEVETNQKNRAIVADRLAAYRAERDDVVAARQAASVFEIIDALGRDANMVIEEYAKHFAGKDRATRDIDMLGALLDRLVETERQMWALSSVHENTANDRNIAIVHDTLSVYAREYDAIRDAQSN